jgi:hypothetical protein
MSSSSVGFTFGHFFLSKMNRPHEVIRPGKFFRWGVGMLLAGGEWEWEWFAGMGSVKESDLVDHGGDVCNVTEGRDY